MLNVRTAFLHARSDRDEPTCTLRNVNNAYVFSWVGRIIKVWLEGNQTPVTVPFVTHLHTLSTKRTMLCGQRVTNQRKIKIARWRYNKTIPAGKWTCIAYYVLSSVFNFLCLSAECTNNANYSHNEQWFCSYTLRWVGTRPNFSFDLSIRSICQWKQNTQQIWTRPICTAWRSG